MAQCNTCKGTGQHCSCSQRSIHEHGRDFTGENAGGGGYPLRTCTTCGGSGAQ